MATGLPLAERFGLPGGLMDAGPITSDKLAGFDSGFVYFGQFVDHTVTFDPTSVLNQQIDPEAIQAFPNPKFHVATWSATDAPNCSGSRHRDFIGISVAPSATGGLE